MARRATTAVRGVTLIDTVIASALMLLVFVAIAGVFQVSLDVITSNKSRAGAVALANERMEYLKSLSYTQIGVVGGIPAGNVVQFETLTNNGVTYERRTLVLYSDDPADGLGAMDTNGITADFKTIRVEVTWTSRIGQRSVEVVGRVSPVGVETSASGGTLTIAVVNAAAQPVSNAQVDIINTGTVPAISIRTYTDSNGSVTFIGAPAASNYQVTVSKIGHSSAQTYPVTVQNPNPDPRHLTVSNNQTTSATFAIDLLAQSTVQTYRAIETATSSDSFADFSQIATSTHIAISGGSAILALPEISGVLQSTDIAPSLLVAWKELSWSLTVPDGTYIRFRIYDASGGTPVLIPDGVLPGNSAGFTTSPVQLSGVATSTYPELRIGATFESNDEAATPELHALHLSYSRGPDPLPGTTFTVRGMKTIGNSPSVYKYDTSHTTDASASITLTGREWDTYIIGLPSGSAYDIAESCAPQPEALAPGAALLTRIYLAPNSAHSLLVDVRGAGALVEKAQVRLSGAGYDTTLPTTSCGQAFFPGLSDQNYSITVSKSGFQDFTNAALDISGDTKLSIVLQ